jgi:hypothetical protein
MDGWMEGGERVPWRDSIWKWSFRTRVRRASWTVWIVALLPEPWKARRVGFGVVMVCFVVVGGC